MALNTVLKIIRIVRKGGAGGGSLAADLIDGALQYGLSAGTVVGMHNAVIHLTRNLSEASPLWRYRGALAGAAGGCGFAFLPRESRRTWAIFLCVRALDQQARILSTKSWVPRPLREFKDADSALMMLVTGFIIYLYIHHPSELSGVYLSFLNRMSQLPLPHVDAVRDMCNGRALDWRAINATTLASAPKGVPLRPSALLKETQAAQQVYDSTLSFSERYCTLIVTSCRISLLSRSTLPRACSSRSQCTYRSLDFQGSSFRGRSYSGTLSTLAPISL